MAKQGLDPNSYDTISSNTDLSEELVMQRSTVARLQAQLDRGEEWVYSEQTSESSLGGTSRVAYSVADLLKANVDILRKMSKTQQEIRPGGDIGGNLRFTIKVEAAAKDAAEEEVPDLGETPDAEIEMAEQEQPSPVVPGKRRGYT